MTRGFMLGVVACSFVATLACADSKQVWMLGSPADVAKADAARVTPETGAVFRMNRASQQALLASAPLEFSVGADHAPIVMVPRPDGMLEAFEVVESPIMEAGLAAKYPQIRTYSAQGIDDPAATARLCMNELGFFAAVLSPDGDYAVAPTDLSIDAVYTSSFSRNQTEWECGTIGEPVATPPNSIAAVTADKLRTYRIAVAMDPRMCVNICGGTVAGGLSAVTTAVNALDAIWEKEMAIRLILVNNNDQVIFTDTNAQPFDTSSNNEMMASNGSVLDAHIGLANFDVGHVFAWVGGGVANLGVVCTGNKSNGLSGNIFSVGAFSNPQTFCHEMGHEFNAPHSWNGAGGSCTAEQWGGSAAYEPGSGSTIMSYAGSCSPDNVQNGRDNYYSQGSVQQITDFSASRTCSVVVATTNHAPTVLTTVINQAPIPTGTPFELTGSATDPDGDALTYTWEERDAGTRRALSAGDAGSGPIFRSFPPSTTGLKRVFPKLSTVLTGNLAGSVGEIMPATSRFMRFRLSARDNRAGGGGQNFTEALIRSYSAGGPFKITEPNTTTARSGAVVVRWLVAGTQTSPFGHTKVNILLSTDGGNTFPTVLAADTPNDGVEAVTLPQTASNCRIRVQPVSAIYFDISDANFSITAAPNSARLISAGSSKVDDAFADGNGNGIAEPGESKLRVYLDVLSNGLLAATNVHATLSTSTPTASVSLPQVDYPDMPLGKMAANMLPAVIALDPAHPCGTPIALTLAITSSEGSWSLSYSLPTGNAGVCSPAVAYCVGDLNLDGQVDDADFAIFVGAYNQLTDPAGDLTGDTLTDDLDFVMFVSAYDQLICP
ncbi:MAG: reprolysin-like metallopeptidase [Phycisphaerales bacterium]